MLVLLVAALALGYTVNRAALFGDRARSGRAPALGLPCWRAARAAARRGCFGGLFLGRRGIAVAVLAVPAFWTLDAFALSGFRFPLLAFSAGLHQPLCRARLRAAGPRHARACRHATRLGPRLRGDDGMGAGDDGTGAGDGGRGAALPAGRSGRASRPARAPGATRRSSRVALPLLYAGALALSSEERIVAAAKALFHDRRASPATVQRPGTGPRPKKSGSEP